METKPLITIAMPVYNVEKYVERALLSVLNQTYDVIEFLVIDDRGTDGSMEVVRRVVRAHPRCDCVKIIEHPCNMKLGSVRNTAIDEAMGDFLFFLDSDDEIPLGAVSSLYELMKENKSDVVIGAFEEVYSDGKTIPHVEENVCYNGNNEIRKSYILNRFPDYTWGKLYNTSFLRRNKIRCIPSCNSEDIVFSLQVFLMASSVSVTSAMVYYYSVVRPGSFNDHNIDGVKYGAARDFVDSSRFFHNYICSMESEPEFKELYTHYLTHYYRFFMNSIRSSNQLNFTQKRDLLKEANPNLPFFKMVNCVDVGVKTIGIFARCFVPPVLLIAEWKIRQLLNRRS